MLINFSSYTQIRVRYSETDQMGYCYYGNYAQYFEVGRVETMRNLGISYKEMENNGIMLPVSEFNVNYHKPALYDDELTIFTKITEIKGPRLMFEYEIKNNKNELLATAKTTLVFVSKENMRPIPPPSSFLNLITCYEI
jgi:acyl-CoA thioester hydrolase